MKPRAMSATKDIKPTSGCPGPGPFFFSHLCHVVFHAGGWFLGTERKGRECRRIPEGCTLYPVNGELTDQTPGRYLVLGVLRMHLEFFCFSGSPLSVSKTIRPTLVSERDS